MTRSQDILPRMKEQNKPAEHEGLRGFWAQGDCVFIQKDCPEDAIEEYRRKVSGAAIGISHNHFCGSIRAPLSRDARRARCAGRA